MIDIPILADKLCQLIAAGPTLLVLAPGGALVVEAVSQEFVFLLSQYAFNVFLEEAAYFDDSIWDGFISDAIGNNTLDASMALCKWGKTHKNNY